MIENSINSRRKFHNITHEFFPFPRPRPRYVLLLAVAGCVILGEALRSNTTEERENDDSRKKKLRKKEGFFVQLALMREKASREKCKWKQKKKRKSWVEVGKNPSDSRLPQHLATVTFLSSPVNHTNFFFYENFFSLSPRAASIPRKRRDGRATDDVWRNCCCFKFYLEISQLRHCFLCALFSRSKVCFFSSDFFLSRFFFRRQQREKERDGFSNEISLKTLAEVVSQAPQHDQFYELHFSLLRHQKEKQKKSELNLHNLIRFTISWTSWLIQYEETTTGIRKVFDLDRVFWFHF